MPRHNSLPTAPEKKFLISLGGAEYLFSLVRDMQQMLRTMAMPMSDAELLKLKNDFINTLSRDLEYL